MEEDELRELRELIEFLRANEIAEFEMERAELKVKIKFAGAAPAIAAAGLDAGQVARLLGTLPAVAASAPVEVAAAAEAAVAVSHPNHQVKSPLVGTFYESPSPGSPAFVSVGDVIEVGQVLCIVEAMKLMNEVESDMAGEVVARIAKSGQPVEYGQPLFEIKAR